VGVRQFLLMIAEVALVGGCEESKEAKAAAEEPQWRQIAAIDAEIRFQLSLAGAEPTGELTKVDLEKVTELNLYGNKLTEVLRGSGEPHAVKEADSRRKQTG